MNAPSSLVFVALLAAGGLTISSRVFAQGDFRQLAPAPSVRWTPEFWLEDRWWTPVSIGGASMPEIRRFAMRRYDDAWQKRVTEDLVQVLTEMGRPPGEMVDLVMRDPDSGEVRTFESVPLTAENRASVRSLEGRVPKSATNLRTSLAEFKAVIDGQWSYRRTNEADFDGAVAALGRKIDGGISANEFEIELQKIIGLGIDGHAEVLRTASPPGGRLPFLIEPDGDRFVAFRPDRSGFLADGFPHVETIDGRPVAEWCAAAAVLVPKGSPQYVRRHSLGHLRDLDFVRGLLGLPIGRTVIVDLSDSQGTTRKAVTLPVAARRAVYGEWPQSGSRVLDGNIGYLRLPVMDDAAAEEIREWMPKFRDTVGLVIDVRDNGGGSREPLRVLYSYLADPRDPPRVFTAAAYRLHPDHERAHLAQRFMYRAGAAAWSEDERRAIAAFARGFRPEWEPPQGEFSEWHYMALSRAEEPGTFHYGKPVVVLMNEKCFSATDLFLAGLKGMNNVTLVGTPSGGGSSFAQEIYLGDTAFRVRLGSIVSFQADGRLFDGHGVAPDVEIGPVPEYHVGGTDNVLAAAVKRITGE